MQNRLSGLRAVNTKEFTVGTTTNNLCNCRFFTMTHYEKKYGLNIDFFKYIFYLGNLENTQVIESFLCGVKKLNYFATYFTK